MIQHEATAPAGAPDYISTCCGALPIEEPDWSAPPTGVCSACDARCEFREATAAESREIEQDAFDATYDDVDDYASASETRHAERSYEASRLREPSGI